MCPSVESVLSKSNVHMNQLSPCFNVLPVIIFSSSLLLPWVSDEEFKFHTEETSVLKLY